MSLRLLCGLQVAWFFSGFGFTRPRDLTTWRSSVISKVQFKLACSSSLRTLSCASGPAVPKTAESEQPKYLNQPMT